METATLLTAGRVLGARAASLCLGTVDGLTQEKIAADEFETREREMFEIALDAIVASLPRAAPGTRL
jgi:uridine phosphorylase